MVTRATLNAIQTSSREEEAVGDEGEAGAEEGDDDSDDHGGGTDATVLTVRPGCKRTNRTRADRAPPAAVVVTVVAEAVVKVSSNALVTRSACEKRS